MKVAVIGSRSIVVQDPGIFIPSECTEIVSGGAVGVDRSAAEYARKNGIKLTEFLPEYAKYGKAAPIVRNRQIVEYADMILAFWDGVSKGTESVIRYAQKTQTPCRVIRSEELCEHPLTQTAQLDQL